MDKVLKIQSKIYWYLILLIGAVVIGLTLVTVEPLIVLILVVAIGTAVIIFFRPVYGGALLLVFAPLEGITTLSSNVTLVKVIAILCAIVLIIRILITPSLLVIDKTSKIILLYLGWTLISISWSMDVIYSFKSWISLFLMCLMYLLVINLIKSQKDLKIVLWSYLIGTIILSYLSVDLLVSREFTRADLIGAANVKQGINLTATFCGIGLFVAILLYGLSTRIITKLSLLLVNILIIISLVILMSRGVWYGVIAGLIIILSVLIKRGHIKAALSLITVLLINVIVVYIVLTSYFLTQSASLKLIERFTSSYSIEDAASGRFYIWKVGLEMTKDSPLLGHGYATFKKNFSNYVENVNTEGHYSSFQEVAPHNAYMNIIVNTGLPGLIIFLFIFYSLTKTFWELLRNRETSWIVVAIGFSLLSFLLLISLVDSSDSRKYLWFTLGLIANISRFYGIKKSYRL